MPLEKILINDKLNDQKILSQEAFSHCRFCKYPFWCLNIVRVEMRVEKCNGKCNYYQKCSNLSVISYIRKLLCQIEIHWFIKELHKKKIFYFLITACWNDKKYQFIIHCKALVWGILLNSYSRIIYTRGCFDILN